MDGIFGVIDDNIKVSIVDSTMMWIVHRAMNKAHNRVKSREGVIERLHEISKFYELSIMQLDGCIKFVQQETDTHNPESGHEEVLLGLAEIRNRLQRRLYESELAILQKDREFADRFESESKLRQTLEIIEKELVCSQEDLEIARSRSGESESNFSHHDGEDESRDGEFCELKDSVDRQVGKIKEKLEFDDDESEVNRRNHCVSDVKVEEMGSDIDILKETLDIAFGKMQSALFYSELGPIEQQIKTSIENDVMSIFLKGFMRDSQQDLEARWKDEQISVSMNEHWSDLMNEVTALCEDLKPFITQNGEEQCNIFNFGSRLPKTEPIIRLSSWTEESPESLKSRFQEVQEKLEILMILNAKVNKSLAQSEDENEENIPLGKEEQVFTENNSQNLDGETLADVWGKIHKLQDEEDIGIQNQICLLRQEKEDKEFQNIMMEEIYITLFKGLREKFCNTFIRNTFDQLDETSESYKLEAQIKDDTYHFVFKEAMKDHCSIEEHKTESLFREEISWFIFSETIKSNTYKANKFCREMVGEWEEKIEAYNLETSMREEIHFSILNEAEREICNRYKKVDVPIQKPPNIGMESLIQKLNLLSEGIEVVENLVVSTSNEIMDRSKDRSVESKDIKCILNSLSNKLEKTMKQFNNKLFVGELKPSLEIIVSEPEKVTQICGVDENVPDSKCLKLLGFPHILYEFELMATEKLEAIMLRLEEMKHSLDPLSQAMASLTENESLYKKAFIRRCQNLIKAENEVDLLGDQVNLLLSLIEKIHLILNQHSPILQRHFDVSEILRLIKKEEGGRR